MTGVRPSTEVSSLTNPQDPALASAASLLATSVPERCTGLVPYHAPGFRSYLAAALEPPAATRTIILRCLRAGGQPYAVADWRLLEGQLFLNGIAVREDRRGRRYGTRLLDDGLALARRWGCGSLALDVSHDNPSARRLYERAGYADASYSLWRTPAATRGPQPPAPPAIRVLDWPVFSAQRRRYGFGDLRVHTAAGIASVRVVGSALRLWAGANEAGVAAVLAPLVGTSRCYVVEASPASGGEGFARFTRMRRAI